MNARIPHELDAVIAARRGVVAAAVQLWGGDGSTAQIIAAVQALADAEQAEAAAHRAREAQAAASALVPTIPTWPAMRPE